MHNKAMYLFFNKPFQVLCQFSAEENKETLANYLSNIPKDVYPVGRLDYDSEGLLLLTNDKKITTELLHPNRKHPRTYWVQVDGDISPAAINMLEKGVCISVNGKKHHTLPCTAFKIAPPDLPERQPPIRYRKDIPTSWISITLIEGKNRQIRKMTAAAGFPTLRLIRYAIGDYTLDNIATGNYMQLTNIDKVRLFNKTP